VGYKWNNRLKICFRKSITRMEYIRLDYYDLVKEAYYESAEFKATTGFYFDFDGQNWIELVDYIKRVS